MNHFILDYETMGQNVFSLPFVDCSVLVFDWDRFTSNPYTFEELIESAKKYKVSVEDQVNNYGAKVERGTVKFWSEQEKEVRIKISPKPDDLTVKQFYEQLIDYLDDFNDIEYWWSRSNTFDPLILQRYAQLIGKKTDEQISKKLNYWTIRDTRTYIDAKSGFNRKMNSFCPISDEAKWNKIFKKHDSTHDIAADVLRLQTLTRLDNDMEIA